MDFNERANLLRCVSPFAILLQQPLYQQILNVQKAANVLLSGAGNDVAIPSGIIIAVKGTSSFN